MSVIGSLSRSARLSGREHTAIYWSVPPIVQSELIDGRDADLCSAEQLIDQHTILRVFDGKTIMVMPLLDGHAEEDAFLGRPVCGSKCPREFYLLLS